MKAPRSLQARLSLSIGGLLVFLWLAAATVTGAVLRHEMDEVFDSAMNPATRCWELGPDGRWTASPQAGREVRDHQVWLMDRHRSS